MAGCTVKNEKASCESISLSFKDVDDFVNLLNQVLCGEVTIMVFTCLEDQPCLPFNVNQASSHTKPMEWLTCCCPQAIPTWVSGSLRLSVTALLLCILELACLLYVPTFICVNHTHSMWIHHVLWGSAWKVAQEPQESPLVHLPHCHCCCMWPFAFHTLSTAQWTPFNTSPHPPYKVRSGGCLIPHMSKYDDMVF